MLGRRAQESPVEKNSFQTQVNFDEAFIVEIVVRQGKFGMSTRMYELTMSVSLSGKI
jgi:hypothetical protein